MRRDKPKILLSYTATIENYIRAVEAVGGIPIVAEPGTEYPECDGLILTGGKDVHPKHYGEEKDDACVVDELRDAFEMSLCAEYAKANKPIFGICRGSQLLNVFFGGSLHQDLAFVGNTHRNGLPTGVRHAVSASRGSILEKIYGEVFYVNSFHHQAVKTVAPDFVVSAESVDDGIIEAIQHEAKPIIGVQWHPERMCLVHGREDLSNGLEIFCVFVDMCCEKL